MKRPEAPFYKLALVVDGKVRVATRYVERPMPEHIGYLNGRGTKGWG
jgi:hypothetical protein